MPKGTVAVAEAGAVITITPELVGRNGAEGAIPVTPGDPDPPPMGLH